MMAQSIVRFCCENTSRSMIKSPEILCLHASHCIATSYQIHFDFFYLLFLFTSLYHCIRVYLPSKAFAWNSIQWTKRFVNYYYVVAIGQSIDVYNDVIMLPFHTLCLCAPPCLAMLMMTQFLHIVKYNSMRQCWHIRPKFSVLPTKITSCQVTLRLRGVCSCCCCCCCCGHTVKDIPRWRRWQSR